MPTTEQLHERWYNEFMYGKPVYADGYNVQGSLPVVGYTKGWLEIEEETKRYKNIAYSLHKKQKSDTYRYL